MIDELNNYSPSEIQAILAGIRKYTLFLQGKIDYIGHVTIAHLVDIGEGAIYGVSPETLLDDSKIRDNDLVFYKREIAKMDELKDCCHHVLREMRNNLK